MKRILLSLLTMLVVLTSSAYEKKSVLVISPYKQSDALTKSSISPFTDLAALHPELDVKQYTLNVSDINTPELYNEFVNDVINHAGGNQPDLVVLSGSQTFSIIEDLVKAWPDVRIVAEGETDYMCSKDYVLSQRPDEDAVRIPLSSIRPKVNMTLIETPVYYDETLDVMCQLKPRTKEVIFIGGVDFYSRECQVAMKKVVEDRGLKYTAVTPLDTDFDELKAMVASRHIDETSILFKSCYIPDNREYYRDDIENAMPVFLMHYMEYKGDHGALGYVSYKYRNFNDKFQEVLDKVLSGSAEPRDIPFTVIGSKGPTINVDCVEHYGISRRLIPEGASLDNVPPTFWERYKNFIVLSSFLALIIMIISVFLARLGYANSQLRKEKDRALDSSARRYHYLQNMSHDVRTPINAIVGFSQLLGLPDGSLTEQEKETYNKYVSNNSNLLMLLVGDILDMSDLENNGYKIDIKDTSCNAICDESVGCAMSRVKPGVKLYYTSEVDDSYTVKTDSRRAEQILINYLTNACKHTDKGEIRLHCSLKEEPGKVVFSVTDTGTGIDPSKAEAIFERYKKLDMTEGHGIGLSICRALANKMGCEVRLDTRYTKGARFIFAIPINK